MEEFLKTVARHYLAEAEQQACLQGEPATLPFSRMLFCFPNRRSGLFFSRYLQQVHAAAHPAADGGVSPCCAPPFITIDQLYAQFTSRHVIDRTALLFRLFHVYDRLSKRRERETFDQFVFWGDMLLSDFDDVDKYLVDARQLFANVRDLKEIDARFSGLTPEQITVIRSFWRNFRPEQEYPEGDKHEVFGQTWAILAPLYEEFRQSLAARNEAYAGMMEREVVEQLSAAGAEGDPFASMPYQKVIFVGLTAVSEVDRRLMSLLRLHGHADFCWDYADPRLQPSGSKATSAAYFTRKNLSDFPNALTNEELQRGLVPDADRQIRLYSVASGVGQTRQASQILMEWREALGDAFDPFRTAVVLPDEKLLLPMLYAVPRELEHFNVTMGYNLRDTPVAAFVQKLIALQANYRADGQTFYYRQVLPLLSHSFTLMLCKEQARALTERIMRDNRYQVPVTHFADVPFLRQMFRPVTDAADAIRYLSDILVCLMEHTEADVDYEFLYHYHKTLSGLAQEVQQSAITFTPKTFFLLLDKLVAGVSVPFQGEPLSGLQVMGVLETRSLDFDNVIILSMNEGVFPAKPSQNTFVPMSLRDAFGMPTQRHRDSVFAYHFYRLLSRASRVALIYDSRSEGMQSGEESRYVKQLRYLMGYDTLVPEAVSEDISLVQPHEIIVRKTPDIMALLHRCTGPDGDLNLSATGLKEYITCPLRFYLTFLRRLREDDEISEDIDLAHFGDILHEALCHLYRPYEGKEIQASTLRRLIDEPQLQVTQCVREAYAKVCHTDHIQGYNELITGLIVDYVVETLRHDLQYCPFTYLSAEGKHHFLYEAAPGLQVRIKCIYDRLDAPHKLQGTVRIVDYKTGNSLHGGKLAMPSVEDLFSPTGRGSSEAFQVMMYCLMLQSASAESLERFHLDHAPAHLVPHLYFVRDFTGHADAPTELRIGGGRSAEVMTDFMPYSEEFHRLLSALITDIFNPDIPFTQCADRKACKRCPFAGLCNRS